MSDMITDPKPPQSPQLFDDATVAEFNTAQLDTVQSDTAQLNRAQTVLRGFQQQNADQLLEGLNPQQQQAVRHSGTPLLIVAGAGSGKTTVLTRRIAYVLATQPVRASQILAITFTNKAAAEMRERVQQIVGAEANYMWVSTFHSMCVRILRAQAAELDVVNSSFTIYDADDSKRLLAMIIKELNLDSKKYP